MARECPEKRGQKANEKGMQLQAQTTKVEKDKKEDTPPTYKAFVSDLHTTIHAITCAKWEKLLEKLIEEDSKEESGQDEKTSQDFA